MAVGESLPFDEAEAARRLGVSKATLSRERLAGKIHPMRHGQRVIRYNDAILDEYRESCRNAPAKLATTGLPNAPAPSSGAGRGTTPGLGRQDAHRLAQTIFSKAS